MDDPAGLSSTHRRRLLPPRLPGPGEALGEYVIEAPLGRGAMGAVFVARHAASGARHALKVLLGVRPERAERFAREARALAKVDRHPGVVRVHAHGTTDDGLAWLALELVTGEDLERVLAAGRVEPRRALRLARGVAAALAHIHAHGVVHRDLKPGNVLLREDDTPVLADFGLARDEEEERMTRSAQVLGTPAYMAPEQLAGRQREVGPATDVFALGVLLHELLTGARPWRGESLLELAAAQHREAPTRPSQLREGLPAGVDDVVLAALAPEPAARPAAAALEAALARVERGEPSGLVPPDARARRRRLLALAAGLALLALAVGLAAAEVGRRAARADAARAWSATAAAAVDACGPARARLAVAARAVRLAPASGDDAPAAAARLREALALARARAPALQAPAPPGAPAEAAAARDAEAAALAAATALAEDALRLDPPAPAAQPPGGPEAAATVPVGEALDLAARGARAPGPGVAERLAALAEALERRREAPPDALDELRLQAAWVALAQGRPADARRQALAAARAGDPTLAAVQARLVALAHAAEAVARVRAGDAAGAAASARAAAAADPRAARALGADLVAAALAGRPPAQQADLLLGLARALAPAPLAREAAAPLVQAARAAADARDGERAAVLLEAAAAADPEAEVPNEVSLPISLTLHERLGRGDLRGAHALATLCVRAGADPSAILSVRDAERLGAAGVIEALAAERPTDPGAQFWLADWLLDRDEPARAARLASLRRAAAAAAQVAAARVPQALRADATLLELRARLALGEPDAPARIEALRATGFPGQWELDKALAHWLHGAGRDAESAAAARRALAGAEARWQESRDGTVPPGGRAIGDPTIICANLHGDIITGLLGAGDVAGARQALDALERLAREPPRERRAAVLLAERRPAEALAELDAALEREPGHLALLGARVAALEALGDPRLAAARADHQRAVRLYEAERAARRGR